MSKEEDKIQHSKRIYDTEIKVKKQVKIAKSNKYAEHDKLMKEPHRLAKQHAMNCGNSECVMCGNPRKFFKELTVQEKKFVDIEKLIED